MDLFAHYALGLFLSKIFDSFWPIPLSMVFDLDKIFGFVYDKARRGHRIKIPRLIHLIYRRRTWFHSFWGVILVTIIFSHFAHPAIIIASCLGHLILDSFDRSGVGTLPPFFNEKIRGPLAVAYIFERPGKRRVKRYSSVSLIVTFIFLALFAFLNI